MKIEKNFDILVELFESQFGVVSQFQGGQTCYNDFLKKIFVSGRYRSVEGKVISWLHEAGHVLQSVTDSPYNDYKKIDDDEKPLEYAMGLFQNENNAWELGYQLAKDWGLFESGVISEKKWNKEKQESLKTYFTV